MRKINVLNLSPSMVSYKPQAGQRTLPVARHGGYVYIPTLLVQRP
jgi:hypothetical protein